MFTEHVTYITSLLFDAYGRAGTDGSTVCSACILNKNLYFSIASNYVLIKWPNYSFNYHYVSFLNRLRRMIKLFQSR